mgnify:FL=1
MVSMIPFGLLAGVVGGREVRITEIDESGFCFRTIEENISDSEALKVCFYDIKNGCYRELEIPEYEIQRSDVGDTELSGFCAKYKVTVKQKAYAEAVQRLLYQYNQYIHLKLEEDDSALAKSLTGYPGELDEIRCDSLEAQVGIWQRELTPEVVESAYNGGRIDLIGNCSKGGNSFKPGCKCQIPHESGLAELALEIDRPELYQAYLRSSLTGFSQKYAGKCIGICGSIILEHGAPDRLYIGNQFCYLLFPERKLLFEIIEKAAAEQVKITLVFSYIREYMLDYITELLDEINQWCEEKRQAVEIVVNDWGMASLVKKYRKNLIPSLGILLNKRRKDPRISFKKGEQKWFERNSLNAGFYRNFLEREYGIQRFEWESCGYEQQIPPGKNSLHIPFYQTNTSQYCPLGAVCETGERGRQKFAKKCPGYCAEYAFLYPEHLHMMGRYNSLFGIDMRILKEEEILEKYIQNGVDRVVIRTW